jgi:hypothetical protein
MIEKFVFMSDDLNEWPEWLRKAWIRKPNLAGAFFPRFDSETSLIKYYIRLPDYSLEEVKHGDTLYWNGIWIEKNIIGQEEESK